MKALDIMEAAGGIDDEIIKEVTSAMQEKNTGKPLRAKRTLRTVLIAAALVLVLAGSALAAGRLINSPAQAVKVARQEIAKMQDMGILSSEYRFFDGEPDYLGEAPNMGVSDYWFGRIFPHSYIVRGGTDDGKYYMNLFVDTMSGKIVHISTEAKADETDTPIPGGDVTVETGNGKETFHTYNNYDDILPDGMTVDKFCTLLAKYWGFSGYRLAQTDDAMFHYAQLNPGGGERLTDFAGANSYLTVYFDGDQSGTPMYIGLDRFPGRVSVLFGMLHQVG